MPSMSFPNVGSQSLPPMSYVDRGPYVPILHNISRPTPLVEGCSGPTSNVHVSQPPASAWVQPQQPNIGNPYYNGSQYNNPLYVAYPRGVTNQWAQIAYGPQVGPNPGQPFVGKNTPTYQQFVG